jgi:hypothetical protein
LKFVPLDADDKRAHALDVLRGKRNDLNHITAR